MGNLFKTMAKAVTYVALAFSLSTTTGCKASDVALAIGVAAGVAVGIASPSSCHGGYETVCTTSYDYFGRRHTDCREVYDSCARYYDARVRIPGVEVGAPEAVRTEAVSADVAKLAEKYSLSFEAAEKLNTAFVDAREGKLETIQALGLGEEDMTRLGKMKLPSEGGIQALAVTLDSSLETTKSLLKSLLKEIKAQMKDGNSAYWQQCLNAQKWATPENTSCKASFWSGCSVETGASACLVLEK